MKRNVFLRAAACLLVAAVMSTSLLGGTGAKYVASAAVIASARVAKFSFVAGSKKYSKTASPSWLANDGAIDSGNGFWNQIAVNAGVPTAFTVPLFDYEYDTVSVTFGGAGSALQTVKARTNADGTRDIIIAPGTGTLFGDPTHNGNYDIQYVSGLDFGKYYFMDFRNDSEVAVRFRLATSYPGDFTIVISDLHLKNDVLWTKLGSTPVVLTHSLQPSGVAPAHSVPLSYIWTPEHEWIQLPPNGTYHLVFGLLFPYETDLAKPDIGSNWSANSVNVNPPAVVNDIDDSMHGVAAREFLKGNTSYAAAAHLDLVFKLEVEQID